MTRLIVGRIMKLVSRLLGLMLICGLAVQAQAQVVFGDPTLQCVDAAGIPMIIDVSADRMQLQVEAAFSMNTFKEKFEIEPTARLSMNKLISTNSVSTSILVFNNFNICICNI